MPDQLQPAFALLLSWQKVELEAWPALLAEVEQQHDINAGKVFLHSFCSIILVRGQNKITYISFLFHAAVVPLALSSSS